MKRPLVWIGTLVTAVITAVAVTLAGSYTTGKFSHASSPKPPSGPPVRILTEAAFADAGMDGGTYFFARPLILNRAQLNTISRFEDTDRIGGPSRYSAWMQAHGGVAADDLIIRLVAAGNRRHLVRILNIDPVGTCTKPLSGTIMNSPSAGDDPTDYIAFNLDDKQPVADSYDDGGFGGSYFARTTVSLRYTAQQVFQILAQTRKHYCQFRLRFAVLDGIKVITETIGNGRQPFRVSGGAPTYQEEYDGGIAGGPDGRFVKADTRRS